MTRTAARPTATQASCGRPLSCLVAHDDAEAVKQTTIAFRSVLPGMRVEAVYSSAEAVDWAPKEAWPVIVFAERLAMTESLGVILQKIRMAAPHAALIIQGEQDIPPRFILTAGSPADYYWTQRLGHAGSELPLLALQLIEKRELLRRLDVSDRVGRQTEQVLSNVTALIRSLTDYYDVGWGAERQAPRQNPIVTKVEAAEQTLTDLLRMLAVRRHTRDAPMSGEALLDQGGDQA